MQKAINAILGRHGMRRMDRVNQAYYMNVEILDGNPPEDDELFLEKLKRGRFVNWFTFLLSKNMNLKHTAEPSCAY